MCLKYILYARYHTKYKYTLSYLLLPTDQLGGFYYYTHFTHEEAEVQQMNGQIPRSQRWSEASWD